jgi:heptosyltransferase I
MKTVGIGDMVLATAIVRDIKVRYPDAALVLLTGPDNAGVARLLDDVEVVALPTAKPWASLPIIRGQRLDALLDLGQWTRLEAVYAALSGATWTAGFETGIYRRHYAYDATVQHSAHLPELENFQRLAALMEVAPSARPHLSPSGSPPPELQDMPYVVFHLWPGGFRGELRQWPDDCWRQLMRRFMQEGCRIVLTGGPGDRRRMDAFLADYEEDMTYVVPAAGRYEMAELIDVLAGARCVVSVNTGLMHLAAASGAPTIALNGPTSSRRWGPVGENVVSVDSALPGCGYLNLGFEYDGQRTDCMSGIAVDRVVRAALERARG